MAIRLLFVTELPFITFTKKLLERQNGNSVSNGHTQTQTQTESEVLRMHHVKRSRLLLKSELANQVLTGGHAHVVIKTAFAFKGKSHLQSKIGYWRSYLFHGSVSAGDALGREHPATPMLSYYAGRSGCKVT